MAKKQGVLKTVASTGGIIFDGESIWYNPEGKCKEYVKPDMRGKNVEIDIKEGTENQFTFIKVLGAGPTTVSQKKGPMPTAPETKKSVKIEIESKHVITLQGKEYITHAGLLDAAHKAGLTNIETELIDSGVESGTAIVRAEVTMKVGIFTGIGDANAENVNKMIFPHKIRMAETRAVNRALRFATNIGMTSSEEMGGDPK